MRLATPLIALLLVAGLAAPGAVSAAPAGPRVVVVVGPVGEATGRYLARGEAAAREAERYTSDVVRVFTPDATWPAVRRALQGASLVVYLGHGNGWPSRYRNELFPPTQNGFGLNPVAGGGNDAHQYFGEQRIRDEVDLADGAIVLLHHLCYASGNTEPGLPEGSVDEAVQRVDNYAAGFIAAGASAVVAEGHMSPAWYVRQLLSADRSISRVWAAAPTHNGNTFSFESRRSPGFVGSMDPDSPGGGFYRSLVSREGAAGGVPAGSGVDTLPEPAEPTLTGTGLELGLPYFKGRPIGGTDVELWVPWSRPAGGSPPSGLMVGVRWDPIDLAGSDGAATPGEPAGEAMPDRITLAQPERIGSVVEPAAVHAGTTRLRVPLRIPAEPGRYRLVLTLHDSQAVAFDAATQALVPSLLVRVAGDLAAEWIAPAAFGVEPGAPLTVAVTVANVGATTWGEDRVGVRQRRSGEAPQQPLVVGRWVRLDAVDGPFEATDPQRRLDAPLAAGTAAVLELVGTAPDAAGDYLLVLDVLVPGQGSLAARGAEPPLVRVTVE